MFSDFQTVDFEVGERVRKRGEERRSHYEVISHDAAFLALISSKFNTECTRKAKIPAKSKRVPLSRFRDTKSFQYSETFLSFAMPIRKISSTDKKESKKSSPKKRNP